MSEIIVKQLAQIVGTPIEVMLQQLQDAGIPASSPDDAITDAQKLQLLEHIRKGQQSEAAVPGKAKLSIKRRSVSERKVTGSQGNKSTVTVEVRRKKRVSSKPVLASTDTSITDEASSTVSKSQELTEKLEAERKALEDVRREETTGNDNKETTAPKSEELKAEAIEEPAIEEPAIEEPAIEEVAKPKEEATQPSLEVEEVAPPQEQEKQKAIEAEVPAATAKPVTPTADKKATPKAKSAPEKKADPASTSTLSRSASSINFFEAARKHKEATGANSARDEAASLLKKRPSRKPKVTIKPTTAAASPATAKAADPAAKKKKKTFQGRGNQLHMSNQGAGSRRRKKGRSRKATIKIERSGKHAFEMPTAPVIKEIEVPETIMLSELAKSLSIQSTDIIKQLMGMGVMATINQTLDQDTAILVTEELGHKAVPVASQEDDEVLLAAVTEEEDEYEKHTRPPVVTIMGHVDHGKTSLLDYIRDSRVTASEAGGITQHIGAYHVDTPNGVITFLDTPGHAAFSSMRARGAQATDIVVVVVAADDSVMPQTKEAIKHTRASGAPLIIAINKMDKENADPERVKSDLSAMEVIPEDWGGDDVFVEVSAITGKGVDSLLESISLVAEIQELKARVDGPAAGLVIEASIEKGRGAVSTVLVQKGTLKSGDIVLCGQEYGRVRAMLDDQGKSIKTVGPSMPASVLGLSGAPRAGDEMLVVSNERKAREIAEVRLHRERDTRLSAQQAAKLEALFANMNSGTEVSQLNILIKADVQGSVEALRQTLLDLSTDEVKINIVSSGVGGINESDASLANAASAVIIAFNVRADASARRISSESAIDIRYYSIIYEAIDDIKAAMSGMLSPELREEFVGLAAVKDVFHSSSLGAVAGCLVTEGTIKQGLPIRVLRDNVVVYEGELESLRRHKDNVNDVHTGTECGIGVKNYNDVKKGDQIECFKRTEVARFIE